MTTHIAIVIDRSGSMSLIKNDAQGAINEFLQSQRELPNDGSTIAIYDFDHDFNEVVKPCPIDECPSYLLEPRGSTALLDAIIRSIGSTKEWVALSKPDKVVLAIITDGQENASEEVDLSIVKSAVEEAKKDWEVLFLSSDIGTFNNAFNQYGFDKHNTVMLSASADGYLSGTHVINNAVTLSRTPYNPQ